MAQDYSINLKATLDTTQVKQQLAQLNAQQQKAQAGTAAGGTAKAGFPNLQNLQSVLSRLAVSLNQFQSTMRQLTAVLRSQNSAIRSVAKPQVINAGSRSGGNSIYAGRASDIKYLDQQEINLKKRQVEYSDKIKKNVAEAARILKNSGVNVPYFEGKGGTKRQSDWMKNYVRQFDDAWLLEHGLGNEDALKQVAMARRAGSRLNAADKISKDLDKAYWKFGQFHGAQSAAKFNAKMNKQFGRLIGAQVLGGAADVAGNLGLTGTSKFLQTSGNAITAGAGVQFAAMQAGMNQNQARYFGGGVFATTGIAALTQAIVDMNKAAAEAAVNLAKTSTALRDAFSGFKGYLVNASVSRRLEKLPDEIAGMSPEARQRYLQNLKARYDEAKPAELEQQYLKRVSNLERDSQRAIGNILKRQSLYQNIPGWLPGKSWFGVSDEDFGKQIKEIQDQTSEQLTRLRSEYENQKTTISQLESEYEKAQQAIKDLNDKEKEKIRLQEQEALRLMELKTAHEAYLKSLSESISKFKGEFTQAAAEQNATIFTQDILANKQMSARDKFRAISERLDAAYDSRNSAQSSVYSSVNELDRFAKSFYMTADVGNLPFAGFMRQMAVQKLTKNIAENQLDLANQNSLVNIFENALKSITQNLVAPDMSHITSISQYGYGMGETDNADQRMEGYLVRQTNLQEQINEKLRQGIKTLPLYAD